MNQQETGTVSVPSAEVVNPGLQQVGSLLQQMSSLLELMKQLVPAIQQPFSNQEAEKVTSSLITVPNNEHSESVTDVTEQQVTAPAMKLAPEISQNQVNMNQKRKIATYTGSNHAVHVEAWFNIFEIVLHDRSDEDKKFLLAQYVDGDALTWFSENIKPRSMTYDQIKTTFIGRFKKQEISPIIAAQERRLDRNESVQAYYDAKMRFLQQTGLKEDSMIAILNRGMPHYYQTALIAAQITSTTKWLSTSLELESNFKRQEKFRKPSLAKVIAADQKTLVANASYSKEGKEKKKPNACRICIKKGYPNQLHWHNECPNRDPDWKPKEKTASAHAGSEN